MNAQELYEEWNDGEKPGMRPKRVQTLRDDIAAATGLTIPHRVPEIEGWLERMTETGVITRKLRDAAAEADGGLELDVEDATDPSDGDEEADE